MINSVINRALKQTVVYWPTPVNDGFGGHTFAAPVEIKCRWTDKTELIKRVNGSEIISPAQVHVDQDLDEEGWLYLGLLADLSTPQKADPMKVGGAYEIVKFGKVPDIRSNEFVRKAYLFRFL